ncbi:MAG TPA: lipopolysaccharide heptosyltransferase II [Ktedonobacterales bacterium]|nr:lipopolysaccharide heptosyltransferase II [Ktedonobacterales bacterium]
MASAQDIPTDHRLATATDDEAERSYDTRPGFDARLAEATKRRLKRRAQQTLRAALAGVGRLTAGMNAGTKDDAIQRILVVRVDLLGDVVLSLPAVRALKRAYPEAQIDMLVLHSTAPILHAEPEVANVLTFDPGVWRRPGGLLRRKTWRDTLAMVREMREAHYDLAISISGDIGSILTRLSGAHRRFGYANEAYRGFLTDPLPGGRYAAHQHEVQYVLALARAAGGLVVAGDEQLKLHVQPDATLVVGDRLRAWRAQTGLRGPLVAIHAGARNGQAKRWPPAHIATLADRLVTELDAVVVLTGAPSEAPLARTILRRTWRPVLNMTGKTSIPELVALLAASDVVVTGDSGPMHIACAVGTPVVALHGPTDPAISGPTAPDAIVLRHHLWCAPCYDASATAECRFSNPVCMKRIAPGMVFAAVRRQLALHERRSHPAEETKSHATFASPS